MAAPNGPAFCCRSCKRLLEKRQKPLILGVIWNFSYQFSSNVIFGEFVFRSLKASPVINPVLTPGGWQEKCNVSEWKLSVGQCEHNVRFPVCWCPTERIYRRWHVSTQVVCYCFGLAFVFWRLQCKYWQRQPVSIKCRLQTGYKMQTKYKILCFCPNPPKNLNISTFIVGHPTTLFNGL